jgi:hypothetical protein
MKTCSSPPMMILGFSLGLGGYGHTHSSVERVKVASAHTQEIKIGRTMELDPIKRLGPTTKKEKALGGNDRVFYESTEIRSLTFPRGSQPKGFFDKE